MCLYKSDNFSELSDYGKILVNAQGVKKSTYSIGQMNRMSYSIPLSVLKYF